MRVLPLLLVLACSVGEQGPAAPGSASAELSASAAGLAQQAAEIEALAHELEVQVDEGRRRMTAGETTQADETARMRALMAQIDTKNTAFQAAVTAWEAELAKRAGNETAPLPTVETDPSRDR